MSANRARVGLVLVAMFTMVMFGSSARAATNPTLGAAGSFGVLAGSTVTNTGPSLVYGNVGVAPGSGVTGFPPGTSQYLAVTGMDVLPRALTGGGLILLGAGVLLEELRRRGAGATV